MSEKLSALIRAQTVKYNALLAPAAPLSEKGQKLVEAINRGFSGNNNKSVRELFSIVTDEDLSEGEVQYFIFPVLSFIKVMAETGGHDYPLESVHLVIRGRTGIKNASFDAPNAESFLTGNTLPDNKDVLGAVSEEEITAALEKLNISSLRDYIVEHKLYFSEPQYQELFELTI